eukprot:SAG31_NODE_12864_length_910_cov_2.966708_1_plen_208_part_10
MMPLLRAVAGAAAVAAAAAAHPTNKKDTYCVLDTESGAPSCDTCEDGACDGWPGAQTHQECKRACGASGSPGKRYAITSIENGRGSHAPVTLSCDDAIEQSSGEFCCFRRANQPETAWRVHCFDAGQPLAKYDVRRIGSGRSALLPFAGDRSSETQSTQRWTFYEESFATYGGEGSRYNQFDRECEASVAAPPPPWSGPCVALVCCWV